MCDARDLRRIRDLNLDIMPVDSSGNLSENYMKSIDRFIEGFPAEKDVLLKSFHADNAKAATKSLLAIRVMLEGVHADELAKECLLYSNKMGKGDEKIPERTKAYVSVLLSSAVSLSIDLQMAILGKDASNTVFAREESAAPVRSAPPEPRNAAVGLDILPPEKKKEILAVDDDTYCLDTFKEALKDVPCKVICVTSGKAALNVLNARNPDLFALDIEMPDMDGLTLAKNIRKRGIKAPIVFITGNSTKEFVIRAVKEGASDFIVKPINPKRAVERINRFL
ncbi:MAG: response regulator [Oscillospiraceae bacterium]|nr:response regulator [Oscillospiraceae bacterium]